MEPFVEIEKQLLAINPFVPNAPFFYPLKTSENMFSGGREGVYWEQMS